MACGTPLAAQQPGGREERKVVTVFFADLVGFTGRAEQLDPEDVRAMLSPYYARLRSEIERFGGTVEKFIGDAVMAVFGAPVTHEDDPERAVRAALAVRDAVQELNEANPALDLHVRIARQHRRGGRRPRRAPVREGEGMVAGDVVNTAARLQTAAPVDGILVGETTYRATERTIEYSESEPVQRQGESRADPGLGGGRRARPRSASTCTSAGGAPLVGRARGARLAAPDGLARTLRERTPQLVTLVGVPGIGKSRLVWELAQAVDADPELIVFWRQGRSLPVRRRRRLLGGGRDGEGAGRDPRDRLRRGRRGEAASRRVADLIPDAESARWIESHLRPLVGLAGEDDPSGDRRDEAFAAWRRFFEALAERRPLVLVFEDLHWADDNLLDFVDYLVDWVSGRAPPRHRHRAAGAARATAGVGRREAERRRPSRSPRSPRRRRRASSPACSSQPVMPAELQAPLLARAGGNPLYAEEYARMVSERGVAPSGRRPAPRDRAGNHGRAARRALGRGQGAHPGRGRAREGVLERRARRHDRAPALDGRGEPARGSNARSSSGASGARRLRPRPSTSSATSSSATSPMARFRVRRRAEKHRRAAEWIETLGPDREDRAEMLAHHYASALEFARAAGQDVSRIAEQARVALCARRATAPTASAPGAPRRASTALLSSFGRRTIPSAGRLLFRYGRVVALHESTGAGVSVLEEARDAFLASGAREEAAEAEVVARATRTGSRAVPIALASICRERPRADRRRAAVALEGVRPQPGRTVRDAR